MGLGPGFPRLLAVFAPSTVAADFHPRWAEKKNHKNNAQRWRDPIVGIGLYDPGTCRGSEVAD